MNRAKGKNKNVCTVCQKAFHYNYQLKYHIRREHFNLVGFENVPVAEIKEVNDVWVEKVANTNEYVELTKVSDTELFIQKVKDVSLSPASPTMTEYKAFDLTDQYPTSSASNKSKTEQCRICQKQFGPSQLSRHFAMCHKAHVTKQCDMCGIPFKTMIYCARHVCPVASLNKKLRKEKDKWIVIDDTLDSDKLDLSKP